MIPGIRSMAGALLGLSVLGWAQVDQRPVFRAGTAAVTVDVSVKRRNASVTGLTAADFVLTDNGVQQQIELVGVDDIPLDVTIVLDQGWHAATFIGAQLPKTLTTIARLLRPADRLAVVTAATDVVETLPLTVPAGWPDGVPPVRVRGHTAAAALLGRPVQQAVDEFNDPTTRSSWFDGLLFALTRPEEHGRRHLVIGVGTVSAGAGEVSMLVHSSALASIGARSPALLHVALHRPPSRYLATIGLATFRRQVLTDAAESTGGSVRDVTGGLDAIKAVLADYRQRYLLRYELHGVPREGWHAISVTSPAFPQYRIEARRGYVGG